MNQRPNSVPCRSAAQIAKHVLLTDPARQALRDDLTARQYLELLWDKQWYADGIHFVAHALPKRAAVWWGCLCLWLVMRTEPPAEADAALCSAVHWVQDPCEDNRCAAGEAGNVAKMQTPAGCVAMAAFFSDTSMNPPDQPKAAPPPTLTAEVLGNGVMMAAFQGDPAQLAQRQRHFLLLGLEVAQGKNRWSQPLP